MAGHHVLWWAQRQLDVSGMTSDRLKWWFFFCFTKVNKNWVHVLESGSWIDQLENAWVCLFSLRLFQFSIWMLNSWADAFYSMCWVWILSPLMGCELRHLSIERLGTNIYSLFLRGLWSPSHFWPAQIRTRDLEAETSSAAIHNRELWFLQKQIH